MTRKQDEERLTGLLQAGRYREVETEARRLVEIHPGSGFAWKLLGTAVGIQGGDAAPILRRAADLLPRDPEVHNNLGNALRNVWQYEEALRSFRRAIELDPRNAILYGNVANTLVDLERPAESVAAYQRALTLNPGLAHVYIGFSNALKELGRLDEAIHCVQKTLQLQPGSAEAHVQMGQLLDELGRSGEAVASFHRALELPPDRPAIQSILLFTRNMLASQTRSSLREHARSFGDMLAGTPAFSAWPNDRNPTRRLRVGLVSGDLIDHPVGLFLEGPLSALDGKQFELFAYRTRDRADNVTRRLEGLIPHWRTAFAMSDAALAQCIRDDGIDILIDLAGHSAHNRLSVFARKPAPVQISWLGYFGSTGVPAMDYVLADPWSVPPGDEDQFTEKVWRLPETRLCFATAEAVPMIAPSPYHAAGHVTYGCFGSIGKATDHVLRVWADVLRAKAGARLLLKARQFAHPGTRERILSRFAAHGIGADRLILEEPSPRSEYLAAYNRVDIVLDTFPYPGG
ncbi:hypothetical protein AYO46_11075, partial [Betaproteobacteria bacterium SCGC AG-212-J23]